MDWRVSLALIGAVVLAFGVTALVLGLKLRARNREILEVQAQLGQLKRQLEAEALQREELLELLAQKEKSDDEAVTDLVGRLSALRYPDES